jgi:4-hydroxybenzoate polyprenyltransferase
MGIPPEPPQGDNKRFDVLMQDYSMAREDDRTFFNIQAAITGVAVALLALIAALVSDTCKLNRYAGCTEPPEIFLAGAPAIPLGVLALLQTFGASSAVRTYYMRALEKEIREYSKTPLAQLAPVANIGPASYAGILAEVTTLRRGRGGYRFLAVLIMLIAFFTFGGLTVYIALNLSSAYRIGMFIGYGIAFAILFANVASVTLGARQTFIRIAKQYSARQNTSMFEVAAAGSGSGSAGERSLASYLIFPRPEDWVKWIFIPFAFVLVSWGRGGGYNWGAMLTALLITEYLVYSARYQWNDIRGLKDDLHHPQSTARSRLPGNEPPRHARFVVGSSLSVAFLRLIAALALGVMLHQTLAVVVLVCVVFGVAIAYESLRQAEADSETAARMLWIIVGVGYAVRFMVGLYASGEPLNSALALVGTAYAYAFGVMFVLVTWTLEGTSFCDRRVANYWYVADDALSRKRHIKLLLSCFRIPDVDPTSPPPSSPLPRPCPRPCGDEPVLATPCHVRSYFAPWRVAFVCASLCSAPLGILLAHHRIDPGLVLLSVLVAALSAVVVVRGSVRVALTAIVACSAALVGMSYLTDVSGSQSARILLAFPWFFNGATYLSFTQQSYSDLKNFAPGLVGQLKHALESVIKRIVGLSTWDVITQRS